MNTLRVQFLLESFKVTTGLVGLLLDEEITPLRLR